jgi:hypothetical protein
MLALGAALLPAADNFVGALGGVSTLSGDAQFEGSPRAVSLYKPENGATWTLFAGRHFADFFSAQASYAWNRNDVLLLNTAPDLISAETPVRASMHTVGVEAMLYFRNRNSLVRPYLSAGPGVMYLSASRNIGGVIAGNTTPAARIAPEPRSSFSGTSPFVRVAVGIDLRICGRLALRYSFAETIQRNLLSRELTPAGTRNLANFQNLWGLNFGF